MGDPEGGPVYGGIPPLKTVVHSFFVSSVPLLPALFPFCPSHARFWVSCCLSPSGIHTSSLPCWYCVLRRIRPPRLLDSAFLLNPIPSNVLFSMFLVVCLASHVSRVASVSPDSVLFSSSVSVVLVFCLFRSSFLWCFFHFNSKRTPPSRCMPQTFHFYYDYIPLVKFARAPSFFFPSNNLLLFSPWGETTKSCGCLEGP